MPKLSANSIRYAAVIGLTLLLAYQYFDPIASLKSSADGVSMSQTLEVSGVDLAQAHEFAKTIDPAIGRVPGERLVEGRKTIEKLASRGLASEEFVEGSWTNIPTEIAGRTRAVWVDPNDSLHLLAGSVTGGMWETENYTGAQDWQMTTDLSSFPPSCIVHDPADATVLYAGSGEAFTSVYTYRSSTIRGQGIMKSTDGGEHWSLLANTSSFQYVTDIAIREEEEGSVVYAGVTSGAYQGRDFSSDNGLYRSDDGGSTWQQVLPVGYSVSDITTTAQGDLLVGTMRDLDGDGGGIILHSSDGFTWREIQPYAGRLTELQREYGEGVFPGRTVLAAAPSDPNRWYALHMAAFVNSYNQFREFDLALYMTADGGVTWKEIAQPEGTWSNIPWHAATIAVDPTDANHLIIGALDIYSADLTGLTSQVEITPNWQKQSVWQVQFYFSEPSHHLFQESRDQFVHADIHSIQFVADDPNRVVVATDGGVFYSNNFENAWSSNSPVTFSYANQNLNTTQYYSVALHPSESWVMGGTQDNGTNLSAGSDELLGYEDFISGGDGAYCFWDADDPELKITSTFGNRYFIHVGDAQVDFTGWVSGMFTNPVDYDDRHNWLFANMSDVAPYGLYSNLDGAYLDSILFLDLNPYLGRGHTLGRDTIRALPASTGTQHPFSAVRVSEFGGTEATLYLGTTAGTVYKVSGLPYSAVATQIDNGQLPQGYISSIAEGPSVGSLIVTFSNFGLESVWYTGDDGLTWRSLDESLDVLPDMPVRWSIFDPRDGRRVFIATELGLFSRHLLTDEAWQLHDDEIPTNRIDMIDIRAEDNTIALATHGNGLWVGQLREDITTENGEYEKGTYSIYPNPTTSSVTVHGPHHPHLLSLYTMDGRKVAEYKPESSGTISLHDVVASTYRLLGHDHHGKILFSQVIQKH